MSTEISQAEKDFLHGQHVESARAWLEECMDRKSLSESSREHLRDVFRGTTHVAGMRQACNVELKLALKERAQ